MDERYEKISECLFEIWRSFYDTEKVHELIYNLACLVEELEEQNVKKCE